MTTTVEHGRLPAARRRHAHIFARAEREHYVEPFWCATRLFEVENFGPLGSRILDPACGLGRILRTATAAGYQVYGSDIVDVRKADELQIKNIPFAVRDFLKIDTTGRFTSSVCNPPFDQIEAFCRRALEIVDFKVAIISPLPRLAAAHWLRSLPLKTVYLMSPRPSMPPAAYLEAGNEGARRTAGVLLARFRTRVGKCTIA